MQTIHKIVVVITTAALAVTLFAGGASAQSGPRPVIQDAQAFRAPIDGKGGIENPFVSCTNYRVEPRVRWVLENTATGYTRTYRWKGALPGVYFPRVKVGTYRSTTTAWCRTNKATRTQTVRVTEKTLRTTISHAEFRRIKRGMSRDRVRHIVGYPGLDAGTYAGERTRNYDMMAFWRWASITYRDGRVVRKAWDVDHD